MKRLYIRFVEWLMRKMNDQYHEHREWMDGEERDEWFTQRQKAYDALKKAKKEQPHE
jgi:antibiotic biosynthesis monooxygenase (ABM) superfamily enzyme